MTLLATQNLSKNFGGLKAVAHVNFRVNNNEKVGIIGPNGAGKTTLINLVSGFIKPTEGKIFYLGEDITNLPIYERARRGIVRTFQLASIFRDLKVIENVALSYLRFTNIYRSMRSRFLGDLLSKEVVSVSLKALEELGLENKAYKKSSELPYGEQRKIEIMMALLQDPKVILIDEPFAGLSEAEIYELLDVLRKYTTQKSVVIIDHKISKVTSFVDRLCVMHEGELICEGKPDDVICDPRVRTIYWKYKNNYLK